MFTFLSQTHSAKLVSSNHLKTGLDIIIVDGSFDILSFLSVSWVKLCLTTIRTPAAL